MFYPEFKPSGQVFRPQGQSENFVLKSKIILVNVLELKFVLYISITRCFELQSHKVGVCMGKWKL